MSKRSDRAAIACCERSLAEKTQSGKHADPIVDLVVEDMVAAGYDAAQLFRDGREIVLPGWFRPAKKWDIAAYDGGALVGAIELKSISSSFGNNANNRAEESIGSAIDVEHATRNHLLEPTVLRPNFGYVIVVNENEKSLCVRQRSEANTPIFGVDSIFDGASYVDRFAILGQRLLEERIYQAVWVVAVDVERGLAREPSSLLTYEKFMANVKSWIDIARA